MEIVYIITTKCVVLVLKSRDFVVRLRQRQLSAKIRRNDRRLQPEARFFSKWKILLVVNAGKKKSQKLKLNFPLADLPELMYKAVRFTQLWNKYKQDAERYVFRTYDPETVRSLVQHLIDSHCGELRKHVANNDTVRPHLLFHCAMHCCGAAKAIETEEC